MIRRISTACAAAAIGTALAGAPPAAHADDGVKVKPAQAEPGQTVKISAPETCVDPVATSNAFPYGVQVQLESVNDQNSPRPVGKTEIDPSATPSAYSVDVKCADGSTITGTVEVVPAGHGHGPDTGGGGLTRVADHTAAPQESWGVMIAAGGGLVLAAGIGAAVWRARRRRTESDV